jgi:hypothetical protein
MKKWIAGWMLGGLGMVLAPFVNAEQVAKIQVESIVMGTDGQMRVRINGQYLTRQSEKDGVKVLDMDYSKVVLLVKGQHIEMKPHQTLNLTQDK